MTDYKQLCAELVDGLELCDWPFKLKETIRADIDRARAALAEPEPEVEPTLREEFTLILNEARCNSTGRVVGNIELGRGLVKAVGRFRRAQPEPEGPTDEELDELFTEIDQSGEPKSWRAYARAVLARWGNHPESPDSSLHPVPVSERLPGPEDCDAEGRCWLCGKVEGDWRLLDPNNSGVPRLKYCFSHWLPAHALPLPS